MAKLNITTLLHIAPYARLLKGINERLLPNCSLDVMNSGVRVLTKEGQSSKEVKYENLGPESLDKYCHPYFELCLLFSDNNCEKYTSRQDALQAVKAKGYARGFINCSGVIMNFTAGQVFVYKPIGDIDYQICAHEQGLTMIIKAILDGLPIEACTLSFLKFENRKATQ